MIAGKEPSGTERIQGIDSIRAVMALWVMLNHVGSPPLSAVIGNGTLVGRLSLDAYKIAFNGQAAVIVFFVISGFCVHFPFRSGAKLNLSGFYIRRYVRVGGPFAIVLVATSFLPTNWGNLESGIFWSIYAELIYYTLYPLLLVASRRVGWLPMVLASALLTPLALLADHPGGNYHAVGDSLAWVIGLPCWLLGCLLAETYNGAGPPVTRSKIVAWRVGIWVASCALYGLRFHTPLKHYHTLNFFSVGVYFWLGLEIRYYLQKSPPAALESAGGWSYSLYLTHFFGWFLWTRFGPEGLGFVAEWVMRTIAVLAFAYVFHLAFEFPFHRLARRMTRIRRRASIPEGTGPA